MSNEVVGSKKTRRKIALRISITSLALAGLIAFAGIFIGGEPWKALSTAGLVFLLNLLVLVSFVSVHREFLITARDVKISCKAID